MSATQCCLNVGQRLRRWPTIKQHWAMVVYTHSHNLNAFVILKKALFTNESGDDAFDCEHSQSVYSTMYAPLGYNRVPLDLTQYSTKMTSNYLISFWRDLTKNICICNIAQLNYFTFQIYNHYCNNYFKLSVYIIQLRSIRHVIK